MSTFFQLILNWCVSTTQWSHTLVDEGSLIQGDAEKQQDLRHTQELQHSCGDFYCYQMITEY